MPKVHWWFPVLLQRLKSLPWLLRPYVICGCCCLWPHLWPLLFSFLKVALASGISGTPQLCWHFSLFCLFFPLPRIPFPQVFQAEYPHGSLLLPFKSSPKWNSQSCFSWIPYLKSHHYFHIPCLSPYYIIFFFIY